MIARESDMAGVDTRLVAAQTAGEWVELVLCLRGSVQRASGRNRWRMRVAGGRVVTFCADWVVAVTHRQRGRWRARSEPLPNR